MNIKIYSIAIMLLVSTIVDGEQQQTNDDSGPDRLIPLSSAIKIKKIIIDEHNIKRIVNEDDCR